MTEEVKRNFLEINSLQDLKEGDKPSSNYSLSLINPINFQYLIYVFGFIYIESNKTYFFNSIIYAWLKYLKK